MNTRKKLIEVALPLDAINDASAYDKMPGIGPHPKGIHQWWARLPLPCARAILFASLVDDPISDPSFGSRSESQRDEERERLFTIIRDLLQKKIHEKEEVFKIAFAEIIRSCEGRLPTVLDPFSGGGAIPLEAQRLGLEAHGSDLNPIAVLITKAMIEIIPRFANQPPVNPDIGTSEMAGGNWIKARGLSEDVRYYGKWIEEQAKNRIGHLYPKIKLPKEYGKAEAEVIAWVWARTVECPNPNCRAQMPLISSFWLSTKKKIWIQPIIDQALKKVRYEIRVGGEAPAPPKIGRGAKFRCVVCTEPANEKHIKASGKEGKIRAQLIAVVADGGRRGRIYLSPTAEHEETAKSSNPEWVPNQKLGHDPRNLWCVNYGLDTFDKLFTKRQLVALSTITQLAREAHDLISSQAQCLGSSTDDQSREKGESLANAYANAVLTFLAFAIDRCADFGNSLCRWTPNNEKVMNLFNRQAIPMVWDYAEANTLANAVGSWNTCYQYVADCIEAVSTKGTAIGHVRQLDATAAITNGSSLLVSTDPPYYDNISYADLSDFFYVWLRRSLGYIYPEICSTLLVPKTAELIAAPQRFDGDDTKAKQHFEIGFGKTLTLIKESLDQRFPMTVYYAFRQAETDEDGDRSSGLASTGWETMLEALVSNGFRISGTWPVRASQKWRMVSMGTNALASYIVLVCRPRSEDAALATRREFLNALKRELPDALKKLQHGNIAPVDLAQASIGPGMSVFSRYSKVLESDGSAMRVRTALQLINQALDEVLAEQESEYDSETRWAVAWFDQFGMTEGAYGTAETLSKAKNTSVTGMDEAGVTISRGGKVRLVSRDELPDDWDPTSDKRLTVWEVAQHLIRALDTGGDAAAASMFTKVGGLAEVARDLAYRLYTTSERKGWTQEAMAYNSLVVAWPEIKRVAAMPATRTSEKLFE